MLQDRALFLLGVAMLAQFQQLLLQGQQPVDPCLDVLNMFIDQRVDAFTLSLRAVAQTQQAADFIQGHVEGSTVADKGQALDMRLGVEPVITLAARRLWQQAFALVVADGFHRAVSRFGQFTDFHCTFPGRLLDPIVATGCVLGNRTFRDEPYAPACQPQPRP